MAYLRCQRQNHVQTCIRTLNPKPIATLYYTEHVHIARIWISIPIAIILIFGMDFCTWIGNVNKPQDVLLVI